MRNLPGLSPLLLVFVACVAAAQEREPLVRNLYLSGNPLQEVPRVNVRLDCSGDLGVGNREHSAFNGWLQESGQTLPGQGWWSAFLQKFGSDERQALRAYVAAAAEFRSRSPATLASLTWRYGGSPPDPAVPRTLAATSRAILDVLLEVRRVGRILMYIGEARVERMAGYIDGYRLCLSLVGLKDEEYARFERWIQDTRRLPSGHTWEDAFLQAARGDHEAAIHQFLDCAAEFRAQPTAP